MAYDIPFGGSGGDTSGWFTRLGSISREEIKAALKDPGDYTKAAGGGLVAWGVFARDSLAALLGVIGSGLSEGVAGFANANSTVLDGLANFPADLVAAVTSGQSLAITESFAEAESAVLSGGIAAWLLVIAELVLLMYLTSLAINYARSKLLGDSSG